MYGKAKLTNRRRRVSVTVHATVDICIAQVSTQDLIAELQEREDFPSKLPNGVKLWPADLCEMMLELLQAGRADDALLLLERTMRPRWPDHASCEAEYKRIKTMGAA